MAGPIFPLAAGARPRRGSTKAPGCKHSRKAANHIMAKMVTFDVEYKDEDDNPIARTISAKPSSKLPTLILVMFASGDELKAVIASAEWALSEADWEELKTLPSENVGIFQDAWEKASAVSVGESDRSST